MWSEAEGREPATAAIKLPGAYCLQMWCTYTVFILGGDGLPSNSIATNNSCLSAVYAWLMCCANNYTLQGKYLFKI